MKEIISKEELEKLKEIKGKVRGVSLKNTSDFIRKEEGEKGLRRFEKELRNLGYSISYENIKAMDFYPMSLWIVYLVLLKRLFNYDDKKIEELGSTNAKFSLIMRLFMKYFVSTDKLIKEVPNMWRKYYSLGDLEISEYDEDKRYAIVRINNFVAHPVLCDDLKGYFSTVVQMVVGQRPRCKESKCPHKGDDYHEFILRW